MKELILSQDSNGEWVATCPIMPGLVIKAKTQTEAVEKMKKAISLYFPCGDCKESG